MEEKKDLLAKLTVIRVGSGEHTFAFQTRVLFNLAYAFDVNLFCFSQLSTVLALSNGTTLFLDFEQRAVGVLAGRGSVAFDACFAVREVNSGR